MFFTFEVKTMDFDKINLHYKKVSYHKHPEDLTTQEWQYALRKQFAESNTFVVERRSNTNGHVYGDYEVYNPESKLSYKVALRSKDNSANFCGCVDFKTNGLGTCKHIEAVFYYVNAKLNKSHLLDKPFTPSYSSVYLDYRDDRKIKIRVGSENKPEFQALAVKYFDNTLTLQEDKYAVFDKLIAEASSISESFRCYPDAMFFVLEKRESLQRHAMVHEKYIKHIDNAAFDTLIHAKLFPYQKEGICFAAGAGRCIIADDMGLGKTIQAIAATELLRKEMGISKVFIICPTSLKYQWQTEIKKFTGQQAWVIEGNFMKRLDQYQNDAFYKIISYNTAINDISEINATSPDLFILDEAQRIKNYKTKISQNIKRLDSPYAFVLTGTPLENKLEELYSIVQFVNPYALGSFWQFIHEHRILDEKGKLKGYRDLNVIGEMLKDTMIRRRKKDVLLQLPERMDKILFVPMTVEQASIHEEYQSHTATLIKRWQRQGFLNEKDRHHLMIFLNTMRMVCDSTFILDQKSRFDTKIGELMNILDEVFAEGSEKVVVFSQWERMTRLVAMELDNRKVKYQYLHGGVPGSDRGKLFEHFNNDPECKVFLSTDAGGVGLNLQIASLLINLDIPWNPAVLEQRIARIYRLGQKRNVSIINMVSTGTIEHKMLGLLDFKKGLAEGILDQGENTVFMPESKFKVFMDTVEGMIDKSPSDGNYVQNNREKEDEMVSEEKIEEGIHESSETPELFPEIIMSSFEDDVKAPAHSVDESHSKHSDPAELVRMSMSFFSQLGETLANPDATQKLISHIVKKDETDGKTYLKIPLENQKVVENALSIFAGLMGAFQK